MPNLQLFSRKWTFVEQVDMSTEKIVFRFNPDSYTPGPFGAHVEIEETESGIQSRQQFEGYHCNQELPVSLSNLRSPSDYTARLYLDDHLAYANRYQDDDLPF